jgi:hypothetical protein
MPARRRLGATLGRRVRFCPDDKVVLPAGGLLANAYPPKAAPKEIRGSAERARTVRAAELSLGSCVRALGC